MKNESKRKKIGIVLTAIIILSALFVGKYLETKSRLSNITESYSFLSMEETANENLFIVHSDSSKAAYMALGRARGFGGELRLALLVDSLGFIQDIDIIHQSETYSFLEKIYNKNYLKHYQSLLLSDLDQEALLPDVITGATYTCRGIEDAVFHAAQNMEDTFQFHLEEPHTNKFRFGLPELALILLYILGFYLNYRSIRKMKWVKWIAAIISIVIIGFIGQKMLTLGNIGSYIMGDWPNIYDYLFWYILMAGIILGLFLKNKNYYCQWVCPFGRVQEVLGAIGNPSTPGVSLKKYLHRVQQMMALLALVLGLLYRNPSKTSFEVFSGLFAFTGSDLLFIALGIIMILSLFIKNPWCHYLCPIKPTINYIRSIKGLFSRKTD